MRLKRVLIILLLIVVVMLISGFLIMNRQSKKMEQLDFSVLNPADLADGIYRGSASAVLVNAKVIVEIKDGRIHTLDLVEHRHGPDYGAEALSDRMVQENRIDVDSISGATFSSLVVKSAVLDALKGGDAK